MHIMMRKKLRKVSVIAVLLPLALAMVTVSCPDPTGGPAAIPAELLGTWVNQSGNSIVVLEYTANQLKISDTQVSTYNAVEDFCTSYEITSGTLTFTGGISAALYSSMVFYKVETLTADEWKDGEITSDSNGEAWYSFPVDIETRYHVWWNESGSNGNGTKSLNVSVRGFYSDGDSVTGFPTTSTAWSSARSFTPTKAGTVYLRVTPGTSGRTGTFGIVYNISADKPAVSFNLFSTPLTADQWENGEITSGSDSIVWYSLTVTSGTTYYFWWNEGGGSYYGNGIKTLDIRVTAYDSEGMVIPDFSSVDTAWSTAKSFAPTASGTVYLRVTPYTSGNTGAYGIVYSETNSRPAVPFTPPNAAIPLITDVWADGELTDSIREVWYSFSVTSGTTYCVWWNDNNSYITSGDGAKTLDVKVSGFYGDGTSIFVDADNAWSTAQNITPNASGTVYLKVTQYYSSGSLTGTFGIVYSTSSTRPTVP
jgi:hypothetical protein